MLVFLFAIVGLKFQIAKEEEPEQSSEINEAMKMSKEFANE